MVSVSADYAVANPPYGLDTSDRTASRVVAKLIEQRLVASPSRLGPLEPGLPFFSLKYLFPGLWPEAEGMMMPPTTGA